MEDQIQELEYQATRLDVITQRIEELQSDFTNDSQEKQLDIEKIRADIGIAQSDISTLKYDFSTKDKEIKQNEAQIGMLIKIIFYC